MNPHFLHCKNKSFSSLNHEYLQYPIQLLFLPPTPLPSLILSPADLPCPDLTRVAHISGPLHWLLSAWNAIPSAIPRLAPYFKPLLRWSMTYHDHLPIPQHSIFSLSSFIFSPVTYYSVYLGLLSVFPREQGLGLLFTEGSGSPEWHLAQITCSIIAEWMNAWMLSHTSKALLCSHLYYSLGTYHTLLCLFLCAPMIHLAR